MQNDCLTPDGKFRVEFETSEMKMSHWVYSPRLTRADGGPPLLDLWGTLWDADVRFERGLVLLLLRKYPGGHADIRAYVDPQQGVFAFADAPWRKEALARFLPALEDRLAGLE